MSGHDSQSHAILSKQSTDPELAQNVEFAAHQAVLDQPVMKKFLIPDRARHLSQRLLSCVVPLIESQYTGSDVKSQWLNEEARLLKIFTIALQMKTQLLISTDLFQCVLPSPGAPFLRESVKIEHGEFSMPQDALVKLTLLPGIQGASANQMVDSNRFVQEGREGLVFKTICKAVVVTM
jgi:hypothetical protein